MILAGLESGIRFGSSVPTLEEGLMFSEGKLRRSGSKGEGSWEETGRRERRGNHGLGVIYVRRVNF